MEAGRGLKISIAVAEVNAAEGFPNAFAMIRSMRPDGLLVLIDALISRRRDEVIAFAASARLPACYGQANNVRDGGLRSPYQEVVDRYLRDGGRRAGIFCVTATRAI